MAKSEKDGKTGFIIAIMFLGVCLLGILAILIWDAVGRINHGWTNSDTIQYIFSSIVAVFGIVTIKPFQDYFIEKNKIVSFQKNDIYRLFISMETNGTIEKYEQYLINKDNDRRLDTINKIVSKKDKTIVVTMDNLNDYFDVKYKIYKKDINFIASTKLSSIFTDILLNKSKKYEKMYASIHSGDYIKEPKFPLFETIIPLLFGIVGIFVTIYEALSVNNPVKEPLTEYLKLFGAAFFFALAFSIFTLRSRIEGRIEYNKIIINELKEVSDNNLNH